MSMKKSNDTIGNQTRDLPVCSTVPQPLCHRVSPALPYLHKIRASKHFHCQIMLINSTLFKPKAVGDNVANTLMEKSCVRGGERRQC
jgi:hypothetical protein